MAKYAAVDIGSNSLRMQVAEITASSPGMRVLAEDRVVTRLGESVFRSGRVSSEAMDFTCQNLERMAKVYQKLAVDGIRVVATSAIRDAHNQNEFRMRASAAAGAPVETISGAEEARLIHLGLQARWPHPDKRLLIVDIGGGSAEIIFSDSGKLLEAYSKPLGALRLKEMFLKSDPPREIELKRMDEYIEQKLVRIVESAAGRRIDRVIATSATASAVVCAINRVARRDREKADRLRATTAQVRKLYAAVSTRDLAGRRKMTGIGPRRAEIIVPGVAVLRRVLQEFRQPALYYCAAGVRDGIIADLFARGVGRELSQLDREQRRVIEQVARHYGVDLADARKVADLAHAMFLELDSLHALPRSCGKLLQAAALLRDTGHYVSNTSHHKHSFYLVANSALPGFTDSERMMVAHLCRYHRKSMPLTAHPEFQQLSAEQKRWVTHLAPILRVADALNRSRKQAVQDVECVLRNGELELKVKSDANVDLELWAAERTADVVREVYQRSLKVLRG